MPNFNIPQKPKEETIEEMVERVGKLSEEVDGVPQIEVDLFGGKNSDEIEPIVTRRKKTRRGNKPKGPGHTGIEMAIPKGDRD